MNARWAALLCVLLALVATRLCVSAETLARVTLDRFTLTSDIRSPQVETPFHLIITAHVRERAADFDNVTLPILTNVELLGDERSTVVNHTGTTYREVITVVAHQSGTIHIEPATLDAIDARDGKPKRYFTNDLTIVVGGGTLQPLAQAGSATRHAALFVTRMLLAFFGIICAVIVIVLLFRRRPATPPPPVEPPQVLPTPTPVQRDPRARLRDGLTVLRAEPTRGSAMRVRHVVRQMVGANDVETLQDVLHRSLVHEYRLREVLIALERAAFTYESDLQTAIATAISALERAVA